MPPEIPPPRAKEVMVAPLDQSSLPVAPSSAYSTAFPDCLARAAAVSLASAERNSPLDVAKTTPLMMVGGNGETSSREVHPVSNAGVPFFSTIFQATSAPDVGCRIQ